MGWVVIDAGTDTMKFNRNSCLRIVGPGWVFSTTVKFRSKTTRIFLVQVVMVIAAAGLGRPRPIYACKC